MNEIINLKEQIAEEVFMATAKLLKERIASGEATPQDVKNAIEFLKHNNVTCAVKQGVVPKGLLDDLDLPFTGED